MKTSCFGRRRRSEKGIAAIEMAVILPVLIILLAVPLFLGRVFWHYTVAQKAAHDAARFLSTATQVEMRTPGAGATEAAAAALARAIVIAETADLNPGGDNSVIIDVHCDLGTCGLGVPTNVRIWVRFRMTDPIFRTFTSAFTGDDGLLIQADVTMRYAGR